MTQVKYLKGMSPPIKLTCVLYFSYLVVYTSVGIDLFQGRLGPKGAEGPEGPEVGYLLISEYHSDIISYRNAI